MQQRLSMLLFALAGSLAFFCPNCANADNALLINELMAKNGLAVEDPQGEYDDYVEIYNASEEALDVAGMYLTNSLSDSMQWQFPLDRPELTVIGPHAYLVIWADKDESDAGLHASFQLNGDGETVALFASDGVSLVDSVEFGKQALDTSYGRFNNEGFY